MSFELYEALMKVAEIMVQKNNLKIISDQDRMIFKPYEYPIKKDMVLLTSLDQVKYIYILLEGCCKMEKYSLEGKVLTDMDIHPIQIFGLLEAVQGFKYYSVSISAASNCYILKVEAKSYLNCIRKSEKLLWVNLRYLSEFVSRSLSHKDSLIMLDDDQKILIKLYHYCQFKDFPVTVALKKEELAQELNINLRTLYRKLEQLYLKNIISKKKGRIVINREQWNAIKTQILESDLSLKNFKNKDF